MCIDRRPSTILRPRAQTSRFYPRFALDNKHPSTTVAPFPTEPRVVHSRKRAKIIPGLHDFPPAQIASFWSANSPRRVQLRSMRLFTLRELDNSLAKRALHLIPETHTAFYLPPPKYKTIWMRERIMANSPTEPLQRRIRMTISAISAVRTRTASHVVGPGSTDHRPGSRRSLMRDQCGDEEQRFWRNVPGGRRSAEPCVRNVSMRCSCSCAVLHDLAS